MAAAQNYRTIDELVCDVAVLLLPPEQVTPAEAAEKYRFLYNPPKYEGPWLNDGVEYLIDPLNALVSPEHDATCFVGPAQSGKTEIILNWLAYTIICDPADFYIFQTQMDTARTFSQDKISKLHRYTSEIRSRIRPGRNADNIFDKFYRTGTRLKISWPSINQFSGHSTPRIALTDYDRMEPDIDKEGSAFFLGRKRTTYFEEMGMTLVESSPGQPVTADAANWRPSKKFPHMAPPCHGILSIYNQGTRNRWYWPCPHCEERFEGSFSLLRWPEQETDFEAAAEQAVMVCPECGSEIEHKHKLELNGRGIWLPEGQSFSEKDKIVGQERRSTIASYWLKGTAAAFVDWKTLVSRHLNATLEYETTGATESLKATVNTDQAEPFIPPRLSQDRLPEDIEERAVDIGKKVVPSWVRCIFLAIDVQKHRFECQVVGYGPDKDRCLIDRFAVRHSVRVDEEGVPYPISPGSYPEDWHLLISAAINKTYPLDDGSGRHMSMRYVGCDSGGRAGVTERAYGFYRYLKKKGLSSRFWLVKGDPRPAVPRIQITHPDSERKDRRAGARGEIPLLMINTTVLKDALDKSLDRLEPGGGYIQFPDWLPSDFYRELCAEVRTVRRWESVAGKPNEAFDLFVYADALALKAGVENINWNSPPNWAAEWDKNSLVFTPGEQQKKSTALSMEELAKKLT